MILKSIICFCFLFCGNSIIGQQFEVIQQKGDVKNAITFQYLARGSYYSINDSLVINNDSCRLAVVDENNKVFIMRPKEENGQFIPQYFPIPYKIQGRPGLITSSISLIHHLNEERNYLIMGDKYSVNITTQFFEMNLDSFFYIRYHWEEDTINKKLLPIDGNFIIISKSDLFQAKFFPEDRFGKDTIIKIPEAEAFQFELRCEKCNYERVFGDPNQPDHLQGRDFIPIKLKFLDSKELEVELKFIIPLLKSVNPNISKAKLFDRVHAYLQDIYEGKIEPDNFEDWIRKNNYILDDFD